MKPAKKKSGQDWKSIVLTSGHWPRTLVVPQRTKVPPGSQSLLCLCTDDEEWDYQLIRGPGGRAYYLRVWPWDYKGEQWQDDETPAARLTPKEAFRFAVANLVPIELLEDCPEQAAAFLKPAKEMTLKPRRKSVEKFSAAICDETQIEFRKLATGGWDVMIYEPLASRVRQLCKRRKISARQFVIDLISRAAAEAKAVKVKKPKAQRGKQAEEMI